MKLQPSALALLLALIGCGLPTAARTGEVLPAGGFELGAHLGGTVGSEREPDAIPLEWLANYGLDLRAGLPGPCEALATLSVLRLGGGGRCGLLQHRRGAPLDLALDGEAFYLPFRGPELRGGLDASVPLGDSVRPLVDLALSRGRHWTFHLSDAPRNIEESKYDRAVGTETRLEATAGLALHLDGEDQPWLTPAITPYWVLGGNGAAHGFGGVMFQLEISGFVGRR